MSLQTWTEDAPNHADEVRRALVYLERIAFIAAEVLNSDDRLDLESWERVNLPDLGTSDWPGFQRYSNILYAPLAPKRATGRPYIPPSLREAVMERDGRACRQCGTTESLSLDHVIPFSRGGTDDIGNLQVLCMPCNLRKGVHE